VHRLNANPHPGHVLRRARHPQRLVKAPYKSLAFFRSDSDLVLASYWHPARRHAVEQLTDQAKRINLVIVNRRRKTEQFSDQRIAPGRIARNIKPFSAIFPRIDCARTALSHAQPRFGNRLATDSGLLDVASCCQMNHGNSCCSRISRG